MAASSYCRRAKLQGIGSSLAFGQKEAAALISQNRRWGMYIERTKSTCPATVFFFPYRAGQDDFVFRFSDLFDGFYRIYNTHI